MRVGKVAHMANTGVQFVHCRGDMLRKYPSESAEHHIPPTALEQRGAELQLQGTDGPAQGGLTDAEQFRRALIVLCVGETFKILQLVQCHSCQPLGLDLPL